MNQKKRKPKFRRGAVMMEYVIVALLIAAAAVAAVAVFGRSIVTGFDVVSRALFADSKDALEAKEDYDGQLENNRKEALEANKQFSDLKNGDSED